MASDPKSILRAIDNCNTANYGPFSNGIYVSSSGDGCEAIGMTGAGAVVYGKLPAMFFPSPNNKSGWQISSRMLLRIGRYIDDAGFEELPHGLKTGDYEIKIAPCDFPDFARKSKISAQIDLSSEQFKDLIKKVAPFASTNEFRVAMMHVLFESDTPRTISAVATDGYRLTKLRLPLTVLDPWPSSTGLLFPRDILALASQYLQGNICIRWHGENDLCISDGTLTIWQSTCKDIYPNYRAIIPHDSKSKLTIDTEHFIDKVMRAMAAADRDTKQITLELSKHSSVITADCAEDGVSYRSKLTGQYAGPDIRIGFNGQFLLDALGAGDPKEIRMRFETPTRAAVIGSEGYARRKEKGAQGYEQAYHH